MAGRYPHWFHLRFIAVPLLLIAIVSISSAACVKGSLCGDSADCCGAECSDGACLCSKTACISSGDCCEGYCEGGMCRKPFNSTVIAEPLRRELSLQLGCIGLVDKCAAGDIGCSGLCTSMTGMFVLMTFGLGGYVYHAFRSRKMALAAMIVPICIGMVTYPFVGIVVAVVLLGLMLAK